MTAMLPNSQLYTQNYRYMPNVCQLQTVADRCYGYAISQDNVDRNTIYDNLKKDKQLQKTVQIMERAGLRQFFRQIGEFPGTDINGLTLFACVDEKIPQSFIDDISLFRAKTFLNAYTLKGSVNIDYLVQNGTSVYRTRSGDNPILCVVNQSTYTVGGDSRRDTEIIINGVGRVVKEINCSNGTIVVMDNIAASAYVNGTY
jgi:hypothetical protein